MAIYLRQVCLLAEKLAPAIDELSAIFSLSSCYVDPAVNKFGVENKLLRIGSQFIEVVAPLETNFPPDKTAAGRFLKRRGGDGGYMVICQVPKIEEQHEVRKRALENKVRIAYESDRETWNIMQLHPADMGAAFFEVDWDNEEDVQGNWHPAGGKAWFTSPPSEIVSAITGLELQSDDPEALAEHWATIAGVTVEHRNGAPTVVLANADLRFVEILDGRGAGLGGIDLRVVDKQTIFAKAKAQHVNIVEDQLTICGTRFNLVN